MNRPTSRAQLWRRAARAFAARNRQALSLEVVRDPEPNETPLSRAEVAYGVREGLIAGHPARESAFPGNRNATSGSTP